jgi:threonine synthase
VAIEDAPFNPRSNRKRWTSDGAKRLVGHQVDNPVSVEEKVRAVKDLTRDDDVAVQVTASLLSRPETASSMPAAERVRVVKELTRDDEVATSVTAELLQRPRVARQAMRNDDVRFTVNRAQLDNAHHGSLYGWYTCGVVVLRTANPRRCRIGRLWLEASTCR